MNSVIPSQYIRDLFNRAHLLLDVLRSIGVGLITKLSLKTEMGKLCIV